MHLHIRHYSSQEPSALHRPLRLSNHIRMHYRIARRSASFNTCQPPCLIGSNACPCTDIEWKLIYVGSAESSSYDQELDSCMVGPVPVGVNSFEFEVGPCFYLSLCFYLWATWAAPQEDGVSFSILLPRRLSIHIMCILLHTITHALSIDRHLLLHLQQSNQTT